MKTFYLKKITGKKTLYAYFQSNLTPRKVLRIKFIYFENKEGALKYELLDQKEANKVWLDCKKEGYVFTSPEEWSEQYKNVLNIHTLVSQKILRDIDKIRQTKKPPQEINEDISADEMKKALTGFLKETLETLKIEMEKNISVKKLTIDQFFLDKNIKRQ